MGKMTINIAAPVSPVYIQNSSTSDSCSSQKSITVKTNGSNKYVEITTSGTGVGNQSGAETITSDKTYYIYVEGAISSVSTNNNQLGSVTIRIRELTSTGEILSVVNLSRKHTGNYC